MGDTSDVLLVVWDQYKIRMRRRFISKHRERESEREERKNMSKRVEKGEKAHFNEACLVIVSQSTEHLEASRPPVFAELMSWSRVSWGQYTAQRPSRQEQAGQVHTWGLLCATTTQTCHVIICAHTIRQHTNTWHHPDAKCTDARRRFTHGHTCGRSFLQDAQAWKHTHTGTTSRSLSLSEAGQKSIFVAQKNCRAPEKHRHAVLRSRGLSPKKTWLLWVVERSVNRSVASAPFIAD